MYIIITPQRPKSKIKTFVETKYVNVALFPPDGFSSEKSNEPRFKSFVGYLLKFGTARDNLHFRPYWVRCHTCSLHLNFIGKLETVVQDRLVLKQVLGLKVKTLNVKAKVHRGPPTRKVAAEMYRTLSPSQIRGLYQMYRLDFELFGYDPEPYLSLGRPD